MFQVTEILPQNSWFYASNSIHKLSNIKKKVNIPTPETVLQALKLLNDWWFLQSVQLLALLVRVKSLAVGKQYIADDSLSIPPNTHQNFSKGQSWSDHRLRRVTVIRQQPLSLNAVIVTYFSTTITISFRNYLFRLIVLTKATRSHLYKAKYKLAKPSIGKLMEIFWLKFLILMNTYILSLQSL